MKSDFRDGKPDRLYCGSPIGKATALCYTSPAGNAQRRQRSRRKEETMQLERRAPSEMKLILKEHLLQKGSAPLFVFPSNVALDSWVEWLVRHPEESGVQAVALECFTAWDRFKGSFLDTQLKDKTAIPSLLRKLFVRDLIHRNNTQERIFAKIIPWDKADSPLSYAFTDWLAKILPSLALWHEKSAAAEAADAIPADEEDGDYLRLYRAYRSFLDAHAFFEPSWERPRFSGSSNQDIVIFYPELLEDFADYEAVFAGIPQLTLIRLPEAGLPKPPVYKFQDSRKELRRLLLHLRTLHEEQGVPWTDIALSVPDIATYAPYIRRECKAYCVPCNLRAGAPLTQNSAGSVFSQISACVAADFSYDSVRALLQNEYVPWKAAYTDKKEALVRRGNEYRCLCSYREGGRLVDTWEESLTAADGDLLAFYRTLKNDLSEICGAQSFAGIRTAWMIFRNRYLDTEAFSEEADRILGRCIAELDDFIEIEETYIQPLGLASGPRFSFFLSELESKIYKQQEAVSGISVFPYKLAAAAKFPYHFVIDASQRNLNIEYKRLSFLNTQKRRRLLADGSGTDMLDSNVSTAFIAMYAKDAPPGEVPFSFAEESFQGFAIAHTALTIREGGYAELDERDFIRNEAADMLALRAGSGRRFTPAMQQAFRAWAQKTAPCGSGQKRESTDYLMRRAAFLLKRAHNSPVYGLTEEHAEAWKLSQTDMRMFYTCPRLWLFAQVLRIREDTLDTSLMQRYDMGTIHHRVLELFLNARMRSGEPLPVTDKQSGRFPDSTEAQLREEIAAFTQQAVHDASRELAQSYLAQTMLRSQTALIAQTIMDFLHLFCRAPEKPSPDELNSHTGIAGFGGFSVQGAERCLSAPSQTPGVRYIGKLDCLLYEPGHPVRYALIDFKNTAASMPAATASWTDSEGMLADFQIPVYATLVESNLCAQEAGLIEAAYFYAIKDGKRTLVIDAYRGAAKNSDSESDTPKDATQFKAAAGKALESYAADFAGHLAAGEADALTPGSASAFVDVKPYLQCVSCSYRSICRTTYTVGRRAPDDSPETKLSQG